MTYDPTKPSRFNDRGFDYEGSHYRTTISQMEARKIARKILRYFGLGHLATNNNLKFKFTCRYPGKGQAEPFCSPRIIRLYPEPRLGIVIHEACHIVAYIKAPDRHEAHKWHGQRFQSYLFRAFRLYGITRNGGGAK